MIPAEVAAAPPDARVGKYVAVTKLGSGGMGEVWKAWDTGLSRWVALKFLRTAESEDLARFKREAELAASLSHPNIAAVYDVGESGGRHYIAMQLIYSRGLARNAGGDAAGAIADFDRTIALDRDHAGTHGNRGAAKQATGDLAGAIADYDRSIALGGVDAQTYYNRGVAKEARGDADGAIADYSRAIELDGRDPRMHYNRGNVKRVRGDLAGAIADYDRSIELNGNYAEAYVNRGFARKTLGDLAGAVADYEAALRVARAEWLPRAKVERMLADVRARLKPP